MQKLFQSIFITKWKNATYTLSNKLHNVVNIYTTSLKIKSYNMYIIGGLRVSLGDADIRLKLRFVSG